MIVEILIYILNIISWGIVARALSSWIPDGRKYTVVQILYKVTDPFIKPIQKVLPTTGMMDFSPLISITLILVIRSVLKSYFL